MMRRRAAETSVGEGENYLASVSDLMSALMFIFIITLAIFVLAFSQRTEELTGAQRERAALLDDIRRGLETRQVTNVIVNTEQGVITFREAILFPTGSADISQEGTRVIGILREVLEDVLPCYVKRKEPEPSDCGDRGRGGKVDALFIEGHTDKRPFAAGRSGRFSDNWELSAARARAVFRDLVEEGKTLPEMRNPSDQFLFSLSGYSDTRPVDLTRDDLNRRIDLRFIMVPPLGALPEPAEAVQKGMQ